MPESSIPSKSADLPKESPRTILFQFVVFPLGVVLIGVAIFVLFGRLATEEHTIPDYLAEIRSGSQHERWQAAYQLSKSLKRGEAKRYPNLEEQVSSIYRDARNDDPRIRRYLAMVLGTLGDRRATPVLVDSLADKDPETRIYALIALGEMRDPAALQAIEKSTVDEERDVRKTAYFTLGELGDVDAIPTLVGGLANETPDVRWNAAISLAQFGDHRAEPVLREMMDRSRLDRVAGMREDQKEDALIVGMSAYMKLEGAAALPELQRIAGTDRSLRVQAEAKQAVASLHK